MRSRRSVGCLRLARWTSKLRYEKSDGNRSRPSYALCTTSSGSSRLPDTSFFADTLSPCSHLSVNVAAPCGSRSHSTVGLPPAALRDDRLTEVVVLPTPPLMFVMARIRIVRLAPQGLTPGYPNPTLEIVIGFRRNLHPPAAHPPVQWQAQASLMPRQGGGFQHERFRMSG